MTAGMVVSGVTVWEVAIAGISDCGVSFWISGIASERFKPQVASSKAGDQKECKMIARLERAAM